ncbi:sulfite exporter TauE/SafE family protein [Actinoplanes sp. NPDC051851]|uniref:sulfite exporter TauE/SafE family protein n=1 Tax=Actinoplanes sp. NPDC051851 TaxID=3154753 RepID=UPI0034295E06
MSAGMALAVTLAVLAGAAAQSATGVGFGVLAAPALLLAAPAAGPFPVLAAGAAVLAVTLAENRAGLRRRVVATVVLAALPGAVLGTALRQAADMRVLQAGVGGLVVISGALTLGAVRIPASRPALAVAGLLGGALNSVASMPGPPLAMVYRPADAEQFRANLSAAFLGMTAVSLVTTVLAHVPSPADLALTLAVTVTALAGQLAGRRWARRLPVRTVRTAAVLLSVLAGAVLVATSAGVHR